MTHRGPSRAARRSAGANRAFIVAMTIVGCLVVYLLYFLVAYSTASP
jgi:cell division septal protein FtsQ